MLREGRATTAASIGDEVAISGPGAATEIDTAAAGYLLAGDETAIPAITIEELALSGAVEVIIEIEDEWARFSRSTNAPRSR